MIELRINQTEKQENFAIVKYKNFNVGILM